MQGKTIMIQGTGSHVGKSVIAAGFCRILQEDGWSVAPFKAQNMSLNSFVTFEGAEIAISQAMQASACKIQPVADMNPILMKPNYDTNSQIIFRGKAIKNMSIAEYANFKKEVFPLVVESLNRLRNDYEVVVIEGAGSPAEINLRNEDIVNMKIAMEGNAPVVLVGDIDKGGVFASFVGTMELLEPEERTHVAAFLINKFRGDSSLLISGIDYLEKRTGVPTLGIIPYFKQLRLPEEDSLPHRNYSNNSKERIHVRVILLPHLSNFTDFDSLQQETDVDLHYVNNPDECRDADLVILPGSKTTVADLQYLKQQGFAEFFRHAYGTTSILGICGGFQMLGRKIVDPLQVESNVPETDGFGLIPCITIFQKEKETKQVSGSLFEHSLPIQGYEIHHGRVQMEASYTPFFSIDDNSIARTEGYLDATTNLYGTSIHGIFDQPGFRRWFLNRIRQKRGLPPLQTSYVDSDLPYQEWAAIVRKNINLELFYKILSNKNESFSH
ncbi:cobyric acid synthase [bacterium]|nr:cobyric acid synthase [bacterium]